MDDKERDVTEGQVEEGEGEGQGYEGDPAFVPDPSMYGIEETMDALDLAASLGVAVYHMAKDGKLSLGDYVHLLPVVPNIGPAAMGATKIPRELGDIQEDEVAMLMSRAKTKFNIPDDLVEEFVENCLDIAVKTFRNVEIIREKYERRGK